MYYFGANVDVRKICTLYNLNNMKLYDLRLNHKFKTIEYFNEIGILMAISVMQA